MMHQIIRRALIGLFALTLALPVTALAQDPSTRSIAARVELHAIPTMTLPDSKFLKGEKDGQSVTVGGELRIAQGSGRLPVVVLMHGSGGIGANIDYWARELNAMGISTFAIDGFTGRGITSVSTNQAQLGRLNFILDIYGALGILAKHPRVDPDRIVLMGFSRGGQAALYASLQRFHSLWNTSGAFFASYIAFYPDCMTSYIDDTRLVDRPVHIFAGKADNYNPVAACKAYGERLKAAGRTIQITEYANGPHGFDSPIAANPAVPSKGAQTVRNCKIKEGPAGMLMNTQTGAEFRYTDSCVELDPHVGADPDAARQVTDAVKTILRGQFKLN